MTQGLSQQDAFNLVDGNTGRSDQIVIQNGQDDQDSVGDFLRADTFDPITGNEGQQNMMNNFTPVADSYEIS